MTDQLQHSVLIDGEVYSIMENNCYPLFNPHDFGIGVVSMGTWCWDGFLVDYECKADQFFARTLYLGISTDDFKIIGVGPDRNDKGDVIVVPGLGRKYTNIWLPIMCTGDLILGKGVNQSNLGVDGYPMRGKCKYHSVMKASFEKGQLINFRDYSSEHQEKLQRILDRMQEHREEHERKESERLINRLKKRFMIFSRN